MKPGTRWRSESRVLDSGAREGAEGEFVRLSSGFTHYEESGPREGGTVVLVHGFSVPYFIWDPTFAALVNSGRRVLRYDLLGRGLSDRPHVEYGLNTFVEQLEELLDALAEPHVDLIGLSMGGAIDAAFATRFPERVRRLGLLDPSGARPISLGMLTRIAMLPGIRDLIFRLAGDSYMLESLARDFYSRAQVESFRGRFREQMEFRGFQRAILSSVRNGMLGGFAEVYARLGQTGIPTLVIWGEDDRTVPFEHSIALRELLPNAEFLGIPRCGHLPHYERPDVVNPRLLTFLG